MRQLLKAQTSTGEPGQPPDSQAGWSIRSREDQDGRTLYSVYIGDRLIVSDALSSDAAVITARQWIAVARDAYVSGTDAHTAESRPSPDGVDGINGESGGAGA